MKIVELNEQTYREYSSVHSKRNFGQTIEYSRIEANRNKSTLLIGMVDDYDNIYAAALLLIRNVSSTIKEAVAPNGFLIDYSDFNLVSEFTELLRKYLFKERITYLITNPMFKYHVYNKKNIMIENNDNIYNNLIKLDYQSIGYFSDFEHFDIIIENNNSYNDIYRNFNRNTKRNIQEGLKLGITLHKGTINDLPLAYEIIKKKSNRKYSFYENLMHIYNTKDNKMEVFFAKLNPHKYLINIQKKYEEVTRENEKIHNKFNNNVGHINERLLNKRINSDNTVEKYRQALSIAIKLNQKYSNDIIIGTSIVIKNNHEIYFLADGYNDEFRHIHSTHILKWAIIRKYFELGYRIFNLGEIHKDYFDKSSKYYGQYKYKLGFGGNIIEYTPNLLLVINKPLYHLHTKINRKK